MTLDWLIRKVCTERARWRLDTRYDANTLILGARLQTKLIRDPEFANILRYMAAPVQGLGPVTGIQTILGLRIVTDFDTPDACELAFCVRDLATDAVLANTKEES